VTGAPPSRPDAGTWLGPLAVVAALGIRAHNLLTYPADWGFDASFNWRYIYRLSRDAALPDPSAGWSTGDPPLYYALAALVFRALEACGARDLAVYAIPLLSTLAGLAIAALAFSLVRRAAPAQPGRAWLAAGLVLFLPAHVHMSAMVNEELLAALCASLALYALARERIEPAAPGARGSLLRAAAAGAAAGLALLAKLSGAIAVATAAASCAAEALRPRARRAAAARVAVVLAAALATGGWFYLRSRVLFGWFQPFGLPAHEAMFEMPPGERGLLDYLRFPLATFLDPQMLDPALLRSVWGGTYASAWFDAHRFFLPRESEAVRRLGTATLLLALVPTAAFIAGLARGARRALRDPAGSPDLPLVLATALSLAGYALYTWRNPWFVVVKGTSLLALCLPFAWYTSAELGRWWQRRAARPLLAGGLAALALCIAAGTTFDALFAKTEVSGLPWQPEAPR
jgi:4-amino-4-deoxy-L-arabinose transferase-like glycosyltransferase